MLKLRRISCTAQTAPGKAWGALWKGLFILTGKDPAADAKCFRPSLTPFTGDQMQSTPATKCLCGYQRQLEGKV